VQGVFKGLTDKPLIRYSERSASSLIASKSVSGRRMVMLLFIMLYRFWVHNIRLGNIDAAQDNGPLLGIIETQEPKV
jgi:hypothetical protein